MVAMNQGKMTAEMVLRRPVQQREGAGSSAKEQNSRKNGAELSVIFQS